MGKSTTDVKLPSTRWHGFTLVELVVVVLIIGIIAAVAFPKVTASTITAKRNAVKQPLAIIRESIELYRAENGSYPANAATLPTLIKPYLKGPFPAAPIGANAGNAAVAAGTDPPAVVAGGAGWAYTVATGDFYLNDAVGLNW